MQISYPHMHEAFPDFDQQSLPTIPSDWTDVSWHNDTCPSFNTNNGWIVFIDYPASYQREFPEGPRFVALGVDAQGNIIEGNGSFSTDDWEAMLKWL